MKIIRRELSKMIDISVLKPEASIKEIEEMCRAAKRYNFKVVYALPWYIPIIRSLLKGTEVEIGAPIAFPFGGVPTEVKVYETTKYLDLGATEFDMVINLGALKSGDYKLVYKDIEEVVKAAQGHIVKVILELPYLEENEVFEACRIAEDAGAHFVKTSTGFAGYVPKVEDVYLMKKALKGNTQVKVAGGVRTLEQVFDLIKAGVTRFGVNMNSAVGIMEKFSQEYGEEYEL
ncbi:MAG: deoxyribose-phosphate aldolase [Thermotogaceae bacterium]|nr:deoxyribose-phosphate aldolase [Thermotogaceae bacterium]